MSCYSTMHSSTLSSTGRLSSTCSYGLSRPHRTVSCYSVWIALGCAGSSDTVSSMHTLFSAELRQEGTDSLQLNTLVK